jgi:hypothetical protein
MSNCCHCGWKKFPQLKFLPVRGRDFRRGFKKSGQKGHASFDLDIKIPTLRPPKALQ